MMARRSFPNTAQKRGNALDDEQGAICAFLDQLGRADVERRHPPMVTVGKDAAGKPLSYHVKGASSVDFEGMICGSARCVIFDNKLTENEHAFLFQQIEEDQMLRAIKKAKRGALAFFYVRHQRKTGGFADYIVPVSKTGELAGVAHRYSDACFMRPGPHPASITWEALDDLGLRIKPGETWLDAVLRMGLHAEPKKSEVETV